MTHRFKRFPHPRRFFGFNTSCFWRRNVLYLYRDMGGASAPPFFCHFPFKNGDFGALLGKICLPLIFLCLPQILIRGRQRKTARREGKIGRRKVFSKVKNVNVESPKNDSKLLDFSVDSFLFFSLRLFSRCHLCNKTILAFQAGYSLPPFVSLTLPLFLSSSL